ncbi:unnamed protein product [Echinostoma caproni]|uniref:Uncharacterized protein n=1 Tax=Echinostoma caproni TaxID=27848 RepID=A0A183AYC7_9TREM|nr:unnamed protein product [Echinostoma caproni]
MDMTTTEQSEETLDDASKHIPHEPTTMRTLSPLSEDDETVTRWQNSDSVEQREDSENEDRQKQSTDDIEQRGERHEERKHDNAETIMKDKDVRERDSTEYDSDHEAQSTFAGSNDTSEHPIDTEAKITQSSSRDDETEPFNPCTCSPPISPEKYPHSGKTTTTPPSTEEEITDGMDSTDRSTFIPCDCQSNESIVITPEPDDGRSTDASYTDRSTHKTRESTASATSPSQSIAETDSDAVTERETNDTVEQREEFEREDKEEERSTHIEKHHEERNETRKYYYEREDKHEDRDGGETGWTKHDPDRELRTEFVGSTESSEHPIDTEAKITQSSSRDDETEPFNPCTCSPPISPDGLIADAGRSRPSVPLHTIVHFVYSYKHIRHVSYDRMTMNFATADAVHCQFQY